MKKDGAPGPVIYHHPAFPNDQRQRDQGRRKWTAETETTDGFSYGSTAGLALPAGLAPRVGGGLRCRHVLRFLPPSWGHVLDGHHGGDGRSGFVFQQDEHREEHGLSREQRRDERAMVLGLAVVWPRAVESLAGDWFLGCCLCRERVSTRAALL